MADAVTRDGHAIQELRKWTARNNSSFEIEYDATAGRIPWTVRIRLNGSKGKGTGNNVRVAISRSLADLEVELGKAKGQLDSGKVSW